MKKLLMLIVFLFPLLVFSYPRVPNINSEPGRLCTMQDKDFSYLRYRERIPFCKRNVSYSKRQKIYDNYKISIEERGDYTIDHIIPLSFGGSNDYRNLWPQNKKIYTGHLEYWLYRHLENSTMRQAEALHLIWSHKYNPVGKDHVPYPAEITEASI